MNKNHQQQFIAMGLLALCLIAVVLGVIQLASKPTDVKASGSEQPGGKRLLGGDSRLAYISIEGMIMEEATESSPFASEPSSVRARKLLYYAAKDPSIKGVLIRLNSPGGTVGMSQELYNAVLAVRKVKPVVASMGDVAASGAYYTAAAADKIVANPGTLTASIGVILQSVNAQQLMNDKLGVKAITIKSGQFKDILSPYRQPTDAELKLLQNIIDTSYKQFLAAVIDGRTKGMNDAEKKNELIQRIVSVADGRVVIGEEAVKVGLVDELGGLEEAKGILQKLAAKRFNIARPEKLTLQEYDTSFTIWDFFGMGANVKIPALAKQANALTSPPQMIPASLRYANQPLWMMESYR